MVKKRIKQLRALSLQEWWLMLTAMMLLPVVALSLRIAGFNKTRDFMSHLFSAPSSQRSLDEIKIEKANITARMISIAARVGPYRANCLKQSLLLWWWFARQGISSEIKFGVPKTPGESFGAHAWVECDGASLSDSQRYYQQFSVLM